MTKPVRGFSKASYLADLTSGVSAYTAIWRIRVGVYTDPVLVVPIDDASVEAMVERAAKAHYNSRELPYPWEEAAEFDRSWYIQIASIALRAALGLDGGGA